MKLFNSMALLTASFLGSSLFATSPTSTLKVATVDMQKVILGVEDGQKAQKDLRKEAESKENQLKKMKESADKIAKEIEDTKKSFQDPLLSNDAKKRKENQLIEKQEELQKKFMEMRNADMTGRNELAQKEGEATQKITMKAAEIVDGMARKNDLDMVFETNSGRILYLKNSSDLTEEVISQYGKASSTKISQK